MSIIDRRVDRLAEFDVRIKQARTVGEAFQAVHEKHELAQQLHADALELQRRYRGWTFIPPS
jgi:hypothetical protein